MKKFYKGTLIISLICIAFGLGMLVLGAVQGGGQMFLNMVGDNEFSISDDNVLSWHGSKENETYEDREYYFPIHEIHKLELDIGASILEIKYADTEQYCVYIQKTQVGSVNCSGEEGVLYIESNAKHQKINFGNAKAHKITLTIPKSAELKNINMTLGAGSCTGKHLFADNINIEVGAGNLELDKLKAEKELKLQVGAGNVDVDSIEAGQLNMACEAGRCYAESVMTERDIDVTCDAGYVYMEIQDTEKSYNHDLEFSLGSIMLADEEYDGIDGSKEIDNNADKNLTAECNVGSIEIDFKQ